MSDNSDDDSTPDLDDLQKELVERIGRELINFKKDGADRRTKRHFEIRLKKIDELRTEFLKRHTEIVSSYKPDCEYLKSNVIEQFENAHLDCLAFIQNEYDNCFPTATVAQSSPISSNTGNASVTSAPPNPTNITYQLMPPTEPLFNMPKFNIPQFSGLYIEWPSFYDSFLQVHNNQRLTSSHKFQYLKNALSPKVKSLIGYLDITAENYDTAWAALIERYNNKRALFSNYLENLLTMPEMSNESADELQTVHDTTRACVFALEKLGINTEGSGEILAHLVLSKLAKSTRLEWQKNLGVTPDIPKFDQLLDFLNTRFRTLEAMFPQTSVNTVKQFPSNGNNSKQFNQPSQKSSHRKEMKSFHVSAKSVACPMGCHSSHPLRNCPSFLQFTVPERKKTADQHNWCINCLGHNRSQSCTSKRNCSTCNRRHHTLLHYDASTYSAPNSSTFNNQYIPSNIESMQVASNNLIRSNQKSSVLLTTAIIGVPDINGQIIRLRALVDQGSQYSVITERAAQLLKLPIQQICVGVRPMGEKQYKVINRGLNISLRSFTSDFEMQTTVAIMPRVTSELPLFPLKTTSWPHIKNLPLADPHYATPGQIDILLAGEVHYKIIRSGLCSGQDGEPIAQNTTLGWIISGDLACQNHVSVFPLSANCCHVSTFEIGECIKKFHELEEVPSVRKLSREDEWTEQYYEQTYQRQSNGKFMVRLPFKFHFDPSFSLGSSYVMALRRFHSLLRKFDRNESFHNAYTQVVNEYKELNQIQRVDTIDDRTLNSNEIKHFYLPHHAVLKESSTTTKLRQVIDGSAKSSNGNSLNDVLTRGPALQADYIAMILNWRTHKFVFIADIEKMYRCIDIHPDDIHYQRILWKDDKSSEIHSYAINCVAFGLKPSPYLAIKTLHKLADLECSVYPLASAVIKKETYVDDVMSGGESIIKTTELITQLIQMLRGAGFELRKWASNSPDVLKQIPSEYRNQNTCLFHADGEIKALGLCWSTTSDSFHFNANFDFSKHPFTKRNTSSIIARLFDPLGWLNPFVTKAKIFLSKLWEARLDWDDPLPSNLHCEWASIIDQLPQINQIKIPRWIKTSIDNQCHELHVFGDSSNDAYSASIYLRTIESNNTIHVSLLIAKSKLTPIRKPLTIARTELCGAVLAVNLLKTVKNNFRLPIKQTFMWTDSTIVLSWIRGDPNRWSIFVCNRVHKILSSTDIKQWGHVVSKDNSADVNSRGLTVNELRESNLWWNGPDWLSKPRKLWPSSPFNLVEDDPEELKSKYKSINAIINKLTRLDFILSRFSNFNRLRRSFAYIFRYIQILRNRIAQKSQNITKSAQSKKELIVQIKNSTPLTVNEIQTAEVALIRWIQAEAFDPELHCLRDNKPIDKASRLHRLNPFIDPIGLIRLDGRLRNAFMSYDEKYPIILPANHRICTLIVEFYHRLTLHGGPQLTINHIRQTYWILNVRKFAGNHIQHCQICFKRRPKLSKQQMGALPSPRVNEHSRPFTATIVDFAGPYDIRVSKGRGQRSYKGYVSIFVCMATKAVHLEAAGDLTSQTFLHAFDRFIARRGLCHDMYSDCGTNFVGANNENQRSHADFERMISSEIIPYLTTRNVQWHFSPPGAPHFNGLAEAAVKAMKYHFTRILSENKLTFEEFSTVLSRIEAVLNSRPISSISNHPNDFTALTPGHFLIGSALLARPQPPADINPVKRYHLMERMVQHFWHRFRSDVLSSSQIRTKWPDKQPNLEINDLVIIKDERFPVNQWPLGRIIALHPGDDQLVRVATVKTQNTMLKRPITKLCLVPAGDTAGS